MPIKRTAPAAMNALLNDFVAPTTARPKGDGRSEDDPHRRHAARPRGDRPRRRPTPTSPSCGSRSPWEVSQPPHCISQVSTNAHAQGIADTVAAVKPAAVFVNTVALAQKFLTILCRAGSVHSAEHPRKVLLRLEAACHGDVHDTRLDRAQHILCALYPVAEDKLMWALAR